jgi:hypothetical protein
MEILGLGDGGECRMGFGKDIKGGLGLLVGLEEIPGRSYIVVDGMEV